MAKYRKEVSVVANPTLTVEVHQGYLGIDLAVGSEEPMFLWVQEAKRLRKALKKAIKTAESNRR